MNNKNDSTWDKVAGQFGKTGPRYWDTFGQRLVTLSGICQGDSVLDIGMGRGASLFPAAQKVGKDGTVIGIDSSRRMVEETEQEIKQKKLEQVKVCQADASKLEYEDETFDAVLCGFGFGYLYHQAHPFQELQRVLRQGGEAGFSIWGVQQDQMWFTEIVNRYLPQPEVPIERKAESFDTVEAVGAILERAGLHEIRVQEEAPQVIYANREAWWTEMKSNAVHTILQQIEALGEAQWAGFQEEVSRGLEQFNSGMGLCFTMPVIYAFGVK